MDKSIRREMKRRAAANMRAHYLAFLFACLVAAVIGARFDGSLEFLNAGAQRIDQISNFLNRFGRENFEANSRGVLAVAVNKLSGNTISGIISEMFLAMDGSSELLLVLGILLSAVLNLLFWMFVANAFEVVLCRMFLEGRVYDHVGMHRLSFLLQVHRWGKVTLAQLRRYAQLSLWWLTIVGGVIKTYSYAMVPFILAENPDLTGKQAVQLSRKMMDGHKWQYFVLDLTMLPWHLLGLLTLGVVNAVYFNGYRLAVQTEFYVQLRQEAIDKGIEEAEAFNDVCLYAKADSDRLAAAYPEDGEQIVVPTRTYKNAVARFFGEVFGLTLLPNEADMEIERIQARKLRQRYALMCASGETYPMRLNPLPIHERKRREPMLYTRRYSVFSLILIFFCFAIVGWIWEVSLHLLSDGVFVNRGALHGPWLPIYGTGGAMVLVLLYRARKRPQMEFVLTVVLCGIVEYFTGLYLELANGGVRWWDYGGYFLNLHGRVCAEGLLVFGLGGMAAVYAVGPALDNLFRKMKRGVIVGVCAVLLILFGVDQAYTKVHPNTGEGITSACVQVEEFREEVSVL